MKKALIIAVLLVSINCHAITPQIEPCNELLQQMLTTPERIEVYSACATLKTCMEQYTQIQETFATNCGSPFALLLATKLKAMGYVFKRPIYVGCLNAYYTAIEEKNYWAANSPRHRQWTNITNQAFKTVEFIQDCIAEQEAAE